MIPTAKCRACGASIYFRRFQSRNRETYDSNFRIAVARIATSCISLFQSRNRETYDSN